VKEPIVTTTARIKPSLVRRGLTFVEVMIAASILAIAAMASLELLAASDATSLTARRQALAAIEGERALSTVAETVRGGGAIPSTKAMSEALVGEALDGCTVRMTGTPAVVSFTIPSATPDGPPRVVDLAVVNLVVEILDPSGETLVEFERAVPAHSGGS
jgi:prepilin-type N-terminal cleavage/methylation domain-containing protein